MLRVAAQVNCFQGKRALNGLISVSDDTKVPRIVFLNSCEFSSLVPKAKRTLASYQEPESLNELRSSISRKTSTQNLAPDLRRMGLSKRREDKRLRD